MSKLKKYVKSITKKKAVEFWGKTYNIKPYLISEIYGDGLAIIEIIPLNTRPNTYVLRFDSNVDLENENNNESETILNIIEEECGNSEDFDEEDTEREFPVLNWNCGGSIDVIKIFKKVNQ